MDLDHPDWTRWTDACRRMSSGISAMLSGLPSTGQRAEVVGVGEGGDRTLVIDAAAEDVIFAELDALRAAGERFTAISEERGEVDHGRGEGALRVVIDPIDGSLNAKRAGGAHAVSLAVADGPTMADVRFGYVFDLSTGEEWIAIDGSGATLDGRVLEAVPARRCDDGRLEVVGIESSDPRLVAGAVDSLVDCAYRVRAVGAIAVTLCQVAAARIDAMVSLRPCRSVDAAAGQLIVREAGGEVTFPGLDAPLAAPLDLLPHAPVAAARDARALEVVASIPSAARAA